MRIIMLAGEKSIGKSTTLNKVYDVLKNDKKANIIMETRPVGNPKHNDFDCIFKYKEKTIRTFSMGDYLDKCIEIIEEIQVETEVGIWDIDILIIASNSEFTLELDEHIKKIDTKNVVVKKNAPTDADNAKALEKIIAELEQAIADMK